ncbi:hypothetical protein AQUCO_02100103v1 [Aquilegia coerulea]|uniref:Uncharacterized protein n=1 Tax=Aquilegia coerulea TaxID=218851 RepID=A0A2G5DET7_AQUCA|nr:hypothetical protein AQUCO_02100103v1 [Aquilegia coerulea]
MLLHLPDTLDAVLRFSAIRTILHGNDHKKKNTFGGRLPHQVLLVEKLCKPMFAQDDLNLLIHYTFREESPHICLFSTTSSSFKVTVKTLDGYHLLQQQIPPQDNQL